MFFYISSTFPPLLFLYRRPFSSLRRTGGMVRGCVERESYGGNRLSQVHLEGCPLNWCVCMFHSKLGLSVKAFNYDQMLPSLSKAQFPLPQLTG